MGIAKRVVDGGLDGSLADGPRPRGRGLRRGVRAPTTPPSASAASSTTAPARPPSPAGRYRSRRRRSVSVKPATGRRVYALEQQGHGEVRFDTLAQMRCRELLRTFSARRRRHMGDPAGASDRRPDPVVRRMKFDGTPLMSPNCWRAIEDAVAARAPCRYLEWGSGNSTIALLRAALENRGGPRLELHSIESDLDFARSMFDAIAETFQRASVDGLVRVEPLCYPKPSLLEALGSDPAVARYEAQFLKVLWYTRNDRFWVMNAEPRAGDLGRWGGLRRYGTTLRCSAAFRLKRVRRALASTDMTETETAVGTVQSPPKPPLRSPTLVTFDTEPVLLQYLVIPQLRNRLWREGPILDGLYAEFADYVSAPLDGRFDVVLVDGHARERRASSGFITTTSSRPVVCSSCTTRTGHRSRRGCSSSAHGPTCGARGAFRRKTRPVERKARRLRRSGRERRCRTSRRSSTGSCTSTSRRSRTTRPGEDCAGPEGVGRVTLRRANLQQRV